MSASELKEEEFLDLIFSKEGFLSRFLNDFEERKEQQEMASQILEAYQHNHLALIEAGTGTGKSLAYLVPAVLWALKRGEKTVISTQTISLQEQLIHKDIPFLLRMLDIDLKAVLVKGMGNYLCLRKLQEVSEQGDLFSQEEKELQKIQAWSAKTKEGSKSEITFPLTLWNKVHAESDSCTYASCPHYRQCFFFKARRTTEEAHLLVVNHHLLLADLVNKGRIDFKEERTILPSYKRLVIDEAHHLEEIAQDSLSTLTSRQELRRLLGRLFSEAHLERSQLTLLQREVAERKQSMNERDFLSIMQRLEIEMLAEKRALALLVEEAFSALDAFCKDLFYEEKSTSSKGASFKWRWTRALFSHPLFYTHVHPLFQNLITSLNRFTQSLFSLEQDVERIDKESKEEKISGLITNLHTTTTRLAEQATALTAFFSETDATGRVQWIEKIPLQNGTDLALIDAPLDVSSHLHEHFFTPLASALLCSATLSTNRDFQFIRSQLGIQDSGNKRIVTEKIYASPFDYEKQSLFLIPNDLPDPTDPSFTSAASESIFKALVACQGNAFVLFTSYDMLRTSYELVKARAHENHFHFLKQEDAPRHTLIERFKAKEGSVLFGTESFWEGVDVPGDALRCVIIAKLPFKVPTDPLFQGLSELLTKKGKNPFFDYGLPQAIMKFKQGVGRLIRKKSDRGCIVCLDKRIVTKAYGKMFFKSLPPSRVIQAPGKEVFEEMKRFYSKELERSGVEPLTSTMPSLRSTN